MSLKSLHVTGKAVVFSSYILQSHHKFRYYILLTPIKLHHKEKENLAKNNRTKEKLAT